MDPRTGEYRTTRPERSWRVTFEGLPVTYDLSWEEACQQVNGRIGPWGIVDIYRRFRVHQDAADSWCVRDHAAKDDHPFDNFGTNYRGVSVSRSIPPCGDGRKAHGSPYLFRSRDAAWRFANKLNDHYGSLIPSAPMGNRQEES